MLTNLVRCLTADGVAKTLATLLTDWPGTATELAEELADWPVSIRVRKREDRELNRRNAFRLDAAEGDPCHWRKGQTLIGTAGGDPLVVADTESTLLLSRLPSGVVAGLGGDMPLGTLLLPYEVRRREQVALAVQNQGKVNERGGLIAVDSTAVLSLEADDGYTRVAIAEEHWTMEFCEFVSVMRAGVLRSQPPEKEILASEAPSASDNCASGRPALRSRARRAVVIP